ncbi:30S ribosome-binding factor RbfA [Proteinivorax hydrogeniformans]|uniref:Ribosome-binding factor A n=1 Tax=Proteinivorax hydrogeniformans TaxID=1826727 RepID=A0AAU8HQR2_9FIRM
MSQQRAIKLAEAIKIETNDIFQKRLKDPRVGFLTITSVDVTNDLRECTIYFTVYGTEQEKTDTLKGVEKAKGFIRSELGKRLKVRHVPELSFKFDHSLEYGNKIDKLLRDINDGK